MRRQQAKYRDLLLYGKKGAFYSTLLRLANSYGIKRDDGIYIDIALTNQELAEFAATSRENLHTSYAATTSQVQRFVVVW